MKKFQSPVRGEIIMKDLGLTPGPEVGQIKSAIEEAILDGIIPNEYEEAAANINTDNDINIQDIILIIEQILS